MGVVNVFMSFYIEMKTKGYIFEKIDLNDDC